MPRSRSFRRASALAALGVAIAVIAVVLLGGGDAYRVRAKFENASQLVEGNRVQVAGAPAGEVEKIELTDDGQAEVTLKIKEDFAPLRRGTLVNVRQTSLSGIANRYLDLQIPPGNGGEIEDGGLIEADKTTSAVDLDQLFNVFDRRTRRGLQQVVRGSATQYAGRSKQAAEGWRYLNPSLAASSRLFQELNRDERLLERFVVESSKLVTDLADRDDDLAGLVDQLAITTGAIGRQKRPLAEAISRLPSFMRRANTTFVNLRATLDDLDPLVDESRPVVRRLRPFLAELRPFARDARPSVRDLAAAVRRPGPRNDLIELTRSTVPLRDAALRRVRENGKLREAAFPASARALERAIKPLSFFRPYTPDLLSWFDDFSHSGIYDALGGVSRVGTHFNAFLFANGLLSPLLPRERAEALLAQTATGQDNRCPGAADQEADDGSNPWKPSEDYNCDRSQVLPGR